MRSLRYLQTTGDLLLAARELKRIGQRHGVTGAGEKPGNRQPEGVRRDLTISRTVTTGKGGGYEQHWFDAGP
jgi:hypothetical protein